MTGGRDNIIPLRKPDASGKANERANERADVARRILELAGTVGEAINHLLAVRDTVFTDVSVYAGMLNDIGEGLISLDNAATAVTDPLGADPEDVQRLTLGYEELSGCLDAMVDACLENRVDALIALEKSLSDSYSVYNGVLGRCFRGASIM